MVECRGLPSAATELLGSPRHSTTRSYCGDASNRFRCIQTACEDMATPGELFSDEILSCLDQEDSEKELDLLMLAASQQYKSVNAPPPTTTDNNSVRASTTRPTTTTTAVVPSHFAPPKTMRMLPNRSRRPGQRDLLKKNPAFRPMKLHDFKSPGSKLCHPCFVLTIFFIQRIFNLLVSFFTAMVCKIGMCWGIMPI